MALFRTRFKLKKDDGPYKNWFGTTFIKKDNHSPASVSIDFSSNKEIVLPKSDQNIYYCLGVPLGMVCKAVLNDEWIIVTEVKKV